MWVNCIEVMPNSDYDALYKPWRPSEAIYSDYGLPRPDTRIAARYADLPAVFAPPARRITGPLAQIILDTDPRSMAR